MAHFSLSKLVLILCDIQVQDSVKVNRKKEKLRNFACDYHFLGTGRFHILQVQDTISRVLPIKNTSE